MTKIMTVTKNIDWTKYTPFQQKVYKTICQIPPGQVWTYQQVAKRMGNVDWTRAVGNALAKNQDAPVIPCHRVVAAKGLGGYSAPGGLKRKIKLLRAEGYEA